ncbi:hypothetical protein GUITHDRAFT_152041 [Guillardia theta CCMP2712]|uniref:Uncharacterized protein n=1 Tax=Guillardia theta (strain CCMP2712) TaxID=905079 RepID=L1JHQ0_GUITC|nr:hypothetical protein GUITHDRAFT_152041 [Guillardia theta CCMP2712]EKX47625.1 hypothetical protein GUITHDRAFT_152041 [Guillardia theta CCMP2712]|mmetsp:Transcript_31962/g.101910  ORF Transcript_31962/g.101910 Transcript_31962/m.101910 type:complete len:80 (+) Transcript_31962:83-322(+)|eukprot:XP_005834605.1 hypothetical protein GUITHDRAFT_152041 [Guillardia theta CCMP2712]
MAARAGNLLRLAARRVNAPALRSSAPLRGGHEGPDPNAPKWEQAVRSVLRKDEHVVFAVIGFWAVVIYGARVSLRSDDD